MRGVPHSLELVLDADLAALPLPVVLDGVVVLGGPRRTGAWRALGARAV
jgi:hypothetical protein